ncbi:MAG: hypothetical protein HQK63_12745 [Desulfamplus sp.]|nr:hypothetical protein [Desulfamplus sp.]
MEGIIDTHATIQSQFFLLSDEERASVISHGAAIRFSELNKRIFLAQSKISFFEEKYNKKLSELEEFGLPEDADYEIHEDYILWNHWADVIRKSREQLVKLEVIVSYGIYIR